MFTARAGASIRQPRRLLYGANMGIKLGCLNKCLRQPCSQLYLATSICIAPCSPCNKQKYDRQLALIWEELSETTERE